MELSVFAYELFTDDVVMSICELRTDEACWTTMHARPMFKYVVGRPIYRVRSVIKGLLPLEMER
jgi:hypothetical protein